MSFTKSIFAVIIFMVALPVFASPSSEEIYTAWKKAAIAHVIASMGESQQKKYRFEDNKKTQGYVALEDRWDKMFLAFRKVWGKEDLWKQRMALSVCIKETWCGLMTPETKWGEWKYVNENGSLDCGLTQINGGSTKYSCEALNASDVLAFKEQKRILEIKVLHKKTIMVDDTSKPRLERCAEKDLDLKAPKVQRKRKRWTYGMRWRRVNGKKVKKRVKTGLETFKRWEYQCRHPQKWVTPRRANTLQTWLDHVWRYNGAKRYGERIAKIYQLFM